MEVYFRKEGNPPDEYDYSVPHKSKDGWRVFFRFVPMLLVLVTIVLCLLPALAKALQ